MADSNTIVIQCLNIPKYKLYFGTMFVNRAVVPFIDRAVTNNGA